MEFIAEVVEDVKKSVKNLKSTEENGGNIDVFIEMIEELARIKSLRVLDVWLDVLAEEAENDAVDKLYNRIKEIRFVEMANKEFLTILNVLTKENTLVYSGFDDLEAWNKVRENKDAHPGIRVEYWKRGVLTDTRFPR